MQQVARIFLKNDENKFILVKHQGKDFWSLPGGHIELGESIYKAIKREVQEELGLKVQLLGNSLGLTIPHVKEKVAPLCSYKISYNEMRDKKIKRLEYIFFGKIKSGTFEKQEAEIESFEFFTLDEIIHKLHTYEQVKQIAAKLKNYV